MEKLIENTEDKIPESKVQCTQKEPYEPPTATFVPLKLEERLMTCNVKYYGGGVPACGPVEVTS